MDSNVVNSQKFLTSRDCLSRFRRFSYVNFQKIQYRRQLITEPMYYVQMYTYMHEVLYHNYSIHETYILIYLLYASYAIQSYQKQF